MVTSTSITNSTPTQPDKKQQKQYAQESDPSAKIPFMCCPSASKTKHTKFIYFMVCSWRAKQVFILGGMITLWAIESINIS